MYCLLCQLKGVSIRVRTNTKSPQLKQCVKDVHDWFLSRVSHLASRVSRLSSSSISPILSSLMLCLSWMFSIDNDDENCNIDGSGFYWDLVAVVLMTRSTTSNVSIKKI